MQRPNRRNYYRILQVQPDAHEAVIRTAYRTLMQKLRLHPDLGGDGATAALINQAYSVLSDPARRAEYDAQLGRGHGRATRPEAGGPGPSELVPAVQAERPAAAGRRPRNGVCPFCAARIPPTAANNPAPRCGACASPLSAPPTARRLSATRRAFERHPVAAQVEYFLHGAAAPRPAQLRDFSPAGAQLTSGETVALNTVLALKTPLFDALARVVGSEPGATRGGWLLRLEFLTLALTAPVGSLVSTRA